MQAPTRLSFRPPLMLISTRLPFGASASEGKGAEYIQHRVNRPSPLAGEHWRGRELVSTTVPYPEACLALKVPRVYSEPLPASQIKLAMRPVTPSRR